MIVLRSIVAAICVFVLPLSACAQQAATTAPIHRYADSSHAEKSRTGMVAAQNRRSAAVGAQILAAGGNAFDAAVGVGFSLAVTLPRAGNIGGGGFMLIHHAESGADVAIDYREMAPLTATRDMYLDESGAIIKDLSRYSHLAAGVPGTVAGFWHVHQKYGRLPWKQILEPAIRQARDGVPMNYDMALLLKARQERLCRYDAMCGYFYKENGKAYEPGELLRQEDLAKTLTLIAEHGADGFYKGETADLIVAEMQRGGGLLDAESLAAYKAIEREPVRGTYRGFEVVTMPPPSSGGIHVLQMLNILENFPIAELGAGGSDNVHLLAEAARLAYADRSKHLGDPDFYNVPVAWLTSKDYGRELAATIDMKKARKSEDVAPGVEPMHESEDTTHFSVIDADGNVAANTYTVNFSFGNGIAVEGAGFVLNNEMDDFVSKPGVANAFGMLGGEANAIEAQKRPLSSMTPTIVFDDGEVWFATGGPGGSVIINTVLQMLVNVIDHGMNLAEAVAAPRIHHQWYPDTLFLETGHSPDTIRALEEKGHVIAISGSMMGSLQTVGYKDGAYRGAADPRRPNAGAVAPGNTQSQ